MADNDTLPAAGSIVASDDIGGVKYQRVKPVHGADGSATDTSAANPLPVTTELPTADLDTGGGTDTKKAVGLLLAAAGGAVPAPGDAANGQDVDVTRMPAVEATSDSIAASLRTDKLSNGLVEITPKFASASVAASSTDTTLIAAVSGKKIRVHALTAQCGGTATDITFESGTTTRVHKIPAGANGGQVLGFNPAGWFETAAVTTALTVTTGTGSTTEITIVYTEV